MPSKGDADRRALTDDFATASVRLKYKPFITFAYETSIGIETVLMA